MITKLNLEYVLFLDIETVPEEIDFDLLSEEKKELWEQKSRYKRKDDSSPKEFYSSAGIWAEFGKIICISVGYFKMKGALRTFRVTSFHGSEEKLLKDFKNLIEIHFSQTKHLLCAHNGKELSLGNLYMPQYRIS